MSIPKFEDLLNPALKAVHKLGGSASVSEMEEEVAKTLNLSDRQVNEIHRGNRTEFGYRLAWSRYYLKKFGLFENSIRGIWALTPEGKRMRRVDKAKVLKSVRTSIKESDTPKKVGPRSTGEEIGSGLTDTWRDELISLVKSIAPDAFERLCQRILRESGFVQVEVTGRSGDGGIDGKGVVKISGLLSFPVVFQCKRFKGSVSPTIVRDFRGAMIGRAEKGLLLTTGSFTREAKREASRDGAPPIDLVDGNDLAEMLRSLRLGVTVERITEEKTVINNDWFDSV